MPDSPKAKNKFVEDEPASQPRRKFNHYLPNDNLPELTAEYLRGLSLEELYHKRNGAKRRSLAVSHIRKRALKDLRRIDAEIKRRRPGPIISIPTVPPPPPNPPKSSDD